MRQNTRAANKSTWLLSSESWRFVAVKGELFATVRGGGDEAGEGLWLRLGAIRVSRVISE